MKLQFAGNAFFAHMIGRENHLTRYFHPQLNRHSEFGKVMLGFAHARLDKCYGRRKLYAKIKLAFSLCFKCRDRGIVACPDKPVLGGAIETDLV